MIDAERWRTTAVTYCRRAVAAAASLGTRLDRLKDAPNLMRPIRALRDGDGKSALLELETAEGFVESGFEVSFVAEVSHQRTPDILGA